MKLKINDPPRSFEVGRTEPKIILRDCAHIKLAPDEQVTFITESAAEYDVVRKEWGFYATPSLNGRLRKFGLKAALVKSVDTGKFNIFLMEKGKGRQFRAYLKSQGHQVVSWLDSTPVLKRAERKMKGR